MIAVQRLFTVLLVFGILLKENTVTGSKNTSSVGASDSLFPSEAIQADYDEVFGGQCEGKTCLRMCCPPGYAGSENGCVEDQFTSYYPMYEKFSVAGINLRLFVDDPCQLSELGTPSLKKYLSFPLNIPGDTDFSRCCVLRAVNSTDFLFGMCRWISICEIFSLTEFRGWYDEFGDIVNILCPLAILIVYSVVPELKNFQGLLIRCLMGSSFCTDVLILIGRHIVEGSSTCNQVFISISCTMVVYSSYVYLSWMMVMNFDIWRNFRKSRSNRHLTTKQYENTKFLRYSLIAWGGPLIPTSVISGCLIWVYAVDGWNDPKLLIMLGVMAFLWILTIMIYVIFYIFMFIATSLTIKRQMNEIARAIDDVEKHHRDSKQWINLYLRLFILMGCSHILTIAGSFWDTYIGHNVLVTLILVQSIMILLLFVWKDSVKRLFRNQVNNILQKLNASRHLDAMPVIRNENEEL